MTENRVRTHDVTSITLTVLFISLMIVAAFWTIRPFLTPFIWAVIIVVATWPAMLRVQSILKGKRWAAVLVMTAGLMMLLVLPLSATIINIVERSGEIMNMVRSLSTVSLASPPGWLADLPLVGAGLTEKWQQLSVTGSQELPQKLIPYSNRILTWFVNQAGNIGMMLLNFLLTVIISAILYAKGEKASNGAISLARRLAGRNGETTLLLAARSIRSVALGVVLTALIQSAIAGAGITIAGIPAPMLVTGIIFVLCIAQIGPAPVLIPCLIWLYWSGETLMGTILLPFAVTACIIDNIIRPILIRRGGDMPLILIFAGVIGGLVAFGIIGLFIGPVVLAVIYTLLTAWVAEGGIAENSASGDPEKGIPQDASI